jgi:hypothetical protein
MKTSRMPRHGFLFPVSRLTSRAPAPMKMKVLSSNPRLSGVIDATDFNATRSLPVFALHRQTHYRNMTAMELMTLFRAAHRRANEGQGAG